jgi:hypothetical protein
MTHLVLLGDSIFDNAAYTEAGPPLVEQIRSLLPSTAIVTLLARDGSICTDITQQITLIPRDATHLVLSIGGNDALGALNLLTQPAKTVADGLRMLANLVAAFRERHAMAVEACNRSGLPLSICTIYDGRLPDPDLRNLTVPALAAYNDAIIRNVFQARLPLIDLRLVCTEDTDYANPIEPSSLGGEKIAKVILSQLLTKIPHQSAVWF